MSPYLYSLEYKASVTGLPIMRPTFMVCQEDTDTYNQGVDFMWGDSILVANVVEKGATTRNVYLPKSSDENIRFYDFNTRDQYSQGETVSMKVGKESIPMFIRSGAIIPMAVNPIYNLTNDAVTDFKIIFAPDIDSSFTIYDDDGKTNNYKKGQYLKTEIKVCHGAKTSIGFTYEGDYKNAINKMELDVIHREKAPYFVTVDGKEVPHFLHRKKYEECEFGWYYSQRLKSVQIKYNNPNKNHSVIISFDNFDMIGM